MKIKCAIILILFFCLSGHLFDTVFAEENNVKQVELETIITGSQISEEEYTFEINVSKAGKLIINFSAESDVTAGSFRWSLTQNYSGSTAWNSINGKFNYSLPVYVEKGKYIFTTKCSGNGTYKIETIFEEAKESFIENQTGGDNTAQTANAINLQNTYYGLIMSDDTDVYKFSVKENSKYTINTTCYASSGWLKYTIYDNNLNVVYNEDLGHYDKAYGGNGKYNKKYDLNPGNYYIAISSMGVFLGGPYSFVIAEEKLVEQIPDQNDPAPIEPNQPHQSVPSSPERPNNPSLSEPIAPPLDLPDEEENDFQESSDPNHNESGETLSSENTNATQRNNQWLALAISCLLVGAVSLIVYAVTKIIINKKRSRS